MMEHESGDVDSGFAPDEGRGVWGMKPPHPIEQGWIDMNSGGIIPDHDSSSSIMTHHD
ncbi:MAG: hypothetical protein MUF72_05185 [Elainella sp. Prado103]|nr:hypothetical protein [Elainella sp. Prado103]